jgi:pyruvate carboxylase
MWRSLARTISHEKRKADEDDPNHIGAPMPGKISSVMVKKGQAIKRGERLLSIEAMKMETAVYSPRDAKIKTSWLRRQHDRRAGSAGRT